MAQLLVIVGMPGSGKTTYIRHLTDSGEIDGFCDDYEYGPLKRINPGVSKDDKRLIAGLLKNERWAVADTRYCDKKERQKLIAALTAKVPNLEFKFTFFENKPELCEHNAFIRKGSLPRHEINLIYYYADLYDIPAGSVVKKIARAG